jgi:hypothetical protein
MERNRDFAKSCIVNTLRSTAFLPVNKKLIKELGIITTVIVCNYIDKDTFFTLENPKSDGWFYLTHNQQMEELNVGDFTIRKVKLFLIENGFIQTKKKGMPAKEWIKINYSKILNLFQQTIPLKSTNNSVEIDDHGRRNQRPYINNKYINNKNNNKIKLHSPSQEEAPIKKPLSKERNKIYLPLANQLAEIITSNKNMHHTPSQIEAWANEIRHIVETSKISIERVEKVLSWYENNYGGKYIPVVESGASLREKFLRLEAAMQKNGYKDTGLNKKAYQSALTSDFRNTDECITNIK